jgi:DNA-binding response OmpR family regulator
MPFAAVLLMGLRILFVEDHNDTRQVLGDLLSHIGFRVQTASDCRTALDCLDEVQFDVLLSDIGLPDGDGCELVAAAKRRQKLTAVALTAFASDTDKDRGKASGFDHYLTKPVNFGELRSLLDKMAA